MISITQTDKRYELCNACLEPATRRISIFYGRQGSTIKLCNKCADELVRKIEDADYGDDAR